MYAGLICLVLSGTYDILRAIVLLFRSNFFQSLDCDGNFISFQLKVSIKGLIRDIPCGFVRIFFRDLMQLLLHI